jgi:ABC-type uncharacterized transport system ATPase subunit
MTETSATAGKPRDPRLILGPPHPSAVRTPAREVPPAPQRSGRLYLNNVTVSFDGFRALNKLSLVVDSGEMRAIIGPNGAGKTTMMDVITGKTRPDEGDVYFGNIDLTRHDEAEIAGRGIGRKFQKPTVFDFHTIWNKRSGS